MARWWRPRAGALVLLAVLTVGAAVVDPARPARRGTLTRTAGSADRP